MAESSIAEEIKMDVAVINNKAANRFEMKVDGYLALIDYGVEGKTMTLMHTIVPKELEGRGIGSRIVNFALESAKKNGLKVAPECPFVRSYIERHEEYQDIVSD